MERGSDFFEKNESAHLGRYDPSDVVAHEDSADEPSPEEPGSIPKSMTMEELYKMKSEILPQLLYVSLMQLVPSYQKSILLVLP